MWRPSSSLPGQFVFSFFFFTLSTQITSKPLLSGVNSHVTTVAGVGFYPGKFTFSLSKLSFRAQEDLSGLRCYGNLRYTATLQVLFRVRHRKPKLDNQLRAK